MQALPSVATMAAVGAAVVAVGVGVSAVSVVPAGHVGVVDVFGKVKDDTIKPGFHVLNPFARVHKMSVKTQLLPVTAAVPTSEGLTVNMDAAVLFRLNPEHAVNVYRTVGTDYARKIVTPHVRATLRDLTAQYEAKALYTRERTKMSGDMKDALQDRLRARGVVVEDTPLKRIQLPPTLSEAIQSKLEMEQQSQRMHFVLERERKEAQRREIEATGIAKFQEIVTQGITPGVLKWKAIEATAKLAESPNSKLVFIGNPRDGLPIMLSHDSEMDEAAGYFNQVARQAIADNAAKKKRKTAAMW